MNEYSLIERFQEKHKGNWGDILDEILFIIVPPNTVIPNWLSENEIEIPDTEMGKRDLCWDLVRENWLEIEQYFEDSPAEIGDYDEDGRRTG